VINENGGASVPFIICIPLICAIKPVVEDSNVSTETHCPGLVVSLSLLLPFLFLEGFLAAVLYAHVGQKGMSVAFNSFGDLPCNNINMIFVNDR